MRSSICVHQFNCSCGDSYTGHTQRALSLLAGEHVPACLAKGITKSVNSVIFSRLTDSEQNIKIDEAFPIFFIKLLTIYITERDYDSSTYLKPPGSTPENLTYVSKRGISGPYVYLRSQLDH